MRKFTFHVVSLPHTQTTAEFTHCAYTQKVRKFCNMMTDLGHDVYLYASEENEARVKELVTVITKEKQREFFGDNDHTKNFFNITWGVHDPPWVHMNANAIRAIAERIGPQDFICVIGGWCQKIIADAFPNNPAVEYGIGYYGPFSKYRVFESYSHMHFVHGLQNDMNGNFYDAVIPNYYDVEEFPFSEKKDDYFLFIGRLNQDKGYGIAQEVCEKLGKRLILAGQGNFSGYGEHVGVVGVEERGQLMSRAKAVFTPSTYIEPFGGVHAEALLTGTPVITTNFGVFTETVVNGVNGYRCDVFRDFVAAAKACEKMPVAQRRKIRAAAQARFSTEHVRDMYQSYFERVYDLWGKGWYAD
jgi:glycosyltransferase involved in cell wall biosynthesis